ncbi:hypothetical protein FISHEDRAFT_73040 [Fistulina hepatica ATCC 64428]|uniref:Ubiquitin 3 binding protein But2 C-terminal domain-containing protein n=1 Tax=Fistulina hepatica ATCC 64428 TaxID=1128425 RepID=A0A0D7AGK6_9AGAR|nr:hypothetical protein FISHEDRAFT_73040 [Fistulina hepatica ATCC 64428]
MCTVAFHVIAVCIAVASTDTVGEVCLTDCTINNSAGTSSGLLFLYRIVSSTSTASFLSSVIMRRVLTSLVLATTIRGAALYFLNSGFSDFLDTGNFLGPPRASHGCSGLVDTTISGSNRPSLCNASEQTGDSDRDAVPFYDSTSFYRPRQLQQKKRSAQMSSSSLVDLQTVQSHPGAKRPRRSSSLLPRQQPDTGPTPQPTGVSSPFTTVMINSETQFALLLPDQQGGAEIQRFFQTDRPIEHVLLAELVSDAEDDGVAYCTPAQAQANDPEHPCTHVMQDGFVTAAAVETSPDGAYIQVTGCLNPALSTLLPSDDGGQFDVRFPDGAQCTFGGYGASFIEQ